MMNIEIIDLRLLPGNRPLKAFCDVRVNDIIIKDFRILQDNGRPYVKAPFVTYKNKVGTLRFRQIIDLPGEVRTRINNMILSEYYREKEQIHEQGSQ